VIVEELLGDAAAAARAGEMIVIPTDTLYGIGTRADDPEATARLFDVKGRGRDRPLPVLVPSVDVARDVAVFDDRAECLVASCWPGGLTIVLPRNEDAMDWELGGDPATIGIRMPRHPRALVVLEAAGTLAVTSANRSGEPPATSCTELRAAFGDAVAVYVCDDAPSEGTASTVVDLAHGALQVVRHGAIGEDVIARLLPERDPLLDSPLSP
jgi:L-threonylcarbamoyladenylate synthase